MAVPMRAHHLLCMLSYSGEGYSPAFVHGFNGIVQRLGAGEPMELVAGPDAICAPLCNDACAHCHNASVTQRDRLAADALAPWLGQALVPGTRVALSALRLAQLRAAFAQGDIRSPGSTCAPTLRRTVLRARYCTWRWTLRPWTDGDDPA